MFDSLFLFGLSHTTEMLAGPALLAVGYAQNWPEWVMGAIAGGGEEPRRPRHCNADRELALARGHYVSPTPLPAEREASCGLYCNCN